MATLTVHIDPPPAVVQPIADGLRRFNEEQVGSSKPQVVVIAASDASGQVIGGIKGLLIWGWVYIEQLWVHETHRQGGIGAALLERLEAEALGRGAQKAVLLTASWQAPHFYAKRGYETVASFDLDIPSAPGARQVDYLLVKPLRALCA